MRKIWLLLKKAVQKIRFELKCREADAIYYSSFSMDPFPPSFYMKHTKEEVEQTIQELRELIQREFGDEEEENISGETGEHKN